MKNTENAHQVTADAPKPPSRRQIRLSRLRRVVIVVLVVGAAAAVWGKVALDRIEARAALVSETGIGLNKFLKEYVQALKAGDVDELLTHYADDYKNPAEGLWSEILHSDRDDIQVYLWAVKNARPFEKADLREQANNLIQRAGKLESAKFKISSIEDASPDGNAVIRGVLWLRGHTADKRTRESRTTFRLDVRREDADWQIVKQEMLKGQTVVGNRTAFEDVTDAAGIAFRSHHNPMLNEKQWRPDTFGIMRYASAGVTVNDFNNDGWPDIFFSDGATPSLYRNNRDGTFEDVTAAVGLPVDLKAVHVALFVDLDNDGDEDLFMGRSTGSNHLFRNNGHTSADRSQYTSAGIKTYSFTDVTEEANVGGLWVATACAGDYDNDGLVDLYLGRYLDPRVNLPTTNFYTRNSEGNSLLHNEGGLRFKDVTELAGVREGGLSLGTSFGDYDRDGDQDLYVANDFGRNALFRNEGNGKFTDVSQETGTVNIGYGMSASWADIDNDSDLDLYVAAVHSGQRWFGNSATLHRYLLSSVQEGTIWDDHPLYREMYSLIEGDWNQFGEQVINGNTLMLNSGDGTFTDVTEDSGCNPHGWYWSSCVFDYDNDGLQDVYTVNGWITGHSTADL